MENVIDIPKSLAGFVKFIWKKKIVSILTIAVVSFLVSSVYSTRKSQFQSEYTILSSKVPFQFIEYIFKPIENAIQNREYDELSRILNVDVGAVQNISFIGLEEIKGLQNLDFKNGFTMTMESSVRNDLQPFGESCVQFLNDNEFINEWKKVYTDNLDELERTTSVQIERLDSIQQMIPGIIANYKGNSNMQQTTFDVGTVYKQMVSLKEKREELIREIKFNREFKVISTSFFQKKSFGTSIFVLALLIFNVVALWLVYLADSLIASTREHL